MNHSDEIKEIVEHIQQQLQMLEGQLGELETVKYALTEFDKAKKNDEVLVPIGAGIFIKTSVKEENKVVLNVGASTAVEKSVKDAVILVDKQIEELKKIEVSMNEELAQMSQQLQFMNLEHENHDE